MGIGKDDVAGSRSQAMNCVLSFRHGTTALPAFSLPRPVDATEGAEDVFEKDVFQRVATSTALSVDVASADQMNQFSTPIVQGNTAVAFDPPAIPTAERRLAQPHDEPLRICVRFNNFLIRCCVAGSVSDEKDKRDLAFARHHSIVVRPFPMWCLVLALGVLSILSLIRSFNTLVLPFHDEDYTCLITIRCVLPK